MYKRVLLTQFGIPNLDTLEYKSNVPLAAGYLAAFSKKTFKDTEFIITPRIFTDILSERDFLDFVENTKPDLFLFSLYVWNIEKTLRISNLLKQKYPSVKILYGGPEVNPDNEFLLKSGVFEYGIVGEGEIPLNEFLSGVPFEKISGALTKASSTLSKDIYNPSKDIRTDFEHNENPYLEGLIEHTPDSTMYFETVRGCPFKCNFCYYNKVYDKIITMDRNSIKKYLDYARNNGLNEIFLLDPSFNAQPDFENLLDELIKLNKDGYFEFSTELRAEMLTDTLIKKLEKLNMVEAEIGLQTTNSSVLKIMNRNSSTEKTISNAKKMNSSNINTKIDLIVGLPGDDLVSFKNTVDRVFKENLYDDIQVFRLSVLSGTEFSINREKYGINAYDIPPYYIESTETFSDIEILEAIEYAQDKFETELYYIPPILLSSEFKYLDKKKFVQFNSEIKPVHKLIFENHNLKTYKNLNNLCESLVLHFKISKPEQDSENIGEILNYFYTEFPHNIYQIVLEYTDDFTNTSLSKILKNIDHIDSYIDRDASGYFGDVSVSNRIALIVNKKYFKSSLYNDLKK
ncbi:MAG: B12-binding domain-containing radical SAM protein, partial [Candidatus Delongbacteria bacterium]|nr:B12-binding domain-containing radical SAM protein [Candidatus Delongbacteria bacterium]